MNSYKINILLSLAIALVAGCELDANDDSGSDEFNVQNPVTDNSDKACYKVTISGEWKSEDHGSLPGGAHFTTPVLIIHNTDYTLFKADETEASAGLESLAETGNTTLLANELDGTKGVKQFLTPSGFASPASETEVSLTFSKNYPTLSLASMVAPTPDWFLGLSGESVLDNNGNFKNNIVLDIDTYDAGTEDGGGFSLDNPDTLPQQLVTLLNPRGTDFTSSETSRISPPLAVMTMKKTANVACL